MTDVPLLQGQRSDNKRHEYKFLTTNEISGSYLSFFFLPLKYMKIYNKKIQNEQIDGFELDFNNLPPLIKLGSSLDDDIYEQINKMEQIWNKYQSEGKEISLYRLAYLTIPIQIKTIFLSLFFNVSLRLLYSYFLGITIHLLSQYFYLVQNQEVVNDDGDELRNKAFISTGLMIIIMLSFIYSDRIFGALAFQGGMKLRVIFTGLLYRKVHQVSLSSINELSLGRFVNIVSSDLALLDVGLRSISTLFVSPFVLIVGLAMMWNIFGIYSFIAIGTTFMYMPIQSFVAKFIEGPKKAKNKAADERLKIMSEIIDTIRILKQYTWEELFKKYAQAIRIQETNAQLQIQKVQSLSSSLSSTSVYVSLIITLYFYVIYGGNNLTADKVFSSILILQIMRSYCVVQFSEGMIAYVNQGISSKRIIEILKLKEIVKIKQLETQRIMNQDIEMGMMDRLIDYNDQDIGTQNNVNSFVIFKNYFGYWSKQNYELKKSVLSDINLHLENSDIGGQLVSVIGRVGQGKTSLLLSILQEIPNQEGELNSQGRIAYVEQEPYVFSGTIRDNIIFGREYDISWYNSVLQASCLNQDIENMPEKDDTYVGEKGVTLSGGQKARLSMARALYSNSDIYLLDDPLSAVDSKVARLLFENGIKGLLRKKIVILVTHLIHFAFECQYLVVLDQGNIKSQGTPSEVIDELGKNFEQYIENVDKQRRSSVRLSQNPLLQKIWGSSNQNQEIEAKATEEEFNEEEDEMQKQQQTQQQLSVTQLLIKKKKTVEQRTQEKDMQHDVSWLTFQNYFRYLGGYTVLFKIYIQFIFESIIIISLSRLFGYWAHDFENKVNLNVEQQYSDIYYLKFAILLIILVFLLSYSKSFYLLSTVMLTATNIFQDMLNRVVRAKSTYFDQTPSGQILSRFSSDLNTVESFLAFNFMTNVEGVISLTLITSTVCIYNPIIFLPSAFLLVVLYGIKKLFTPFLKYSRICDSVTRTPLNTELASTLQGLIVIRAYKQGSNYVKKYQQYLYENVLSILSFSRSNTTLSFVLELALFFQIAAGSSLIIYSALTSGQLRDPGELGFYLLLLIQTSDNFANVFRSFFLIEINMNNVERMFGLTRIESESPLTLVSDDTLPKNWPQNGFIEFKNVNLKYTQQLGEIENNYALRQLNFNIKSGTRVGIVGRTGAGKSSILQVLFRMVEIEKQANDDGIYIDGQPIDQIGLHLLRGSLSIIPQQPVVFQGTIRRNLDPLQLKTDSHIMQVLEEVGLRKTVESLPSSLNTDMSISSSVFSVGQKQLMCMARALLYKNRIVVLDEATSNVDLKTDIFIQKMIKDKFNGCTILTIAHRLETVADYDAIIVMDKGQLVEYDHPFKLLTNKQTDQKITRIQGYFSQMCLNTGKSTSQKIFKIAQTQYLKRILV